jgi:hypothetical protein
MANFTTVFSNDYMRGVVRDTFPPTTFGINQTTEGFFENVWPISTTEVTLTPTNITTSGLAFFRNIGSNFVNIGDSTGDYFTRLKPGEFAWLRLHPSVTTLYGVADTATVSVHVKVFND